MRQPKSGPTRLATGGAPVDLLTPSPGPADESGIPGAYSSGLLVLVDPRSKIKGNISNRKKRPAGQASEHQAWGPGCECLEACLLVLRREMACRRTYP